MTTVIFTNNYSDLSGSYRTGWRSTLPDDLAQQLISSGTAKLDDSTDAPENPDPAAEPPVSKPKRARKAAPIDEQYVAPSTPEV